MQNLEYSLVESVIVTVTVFLSSIEIPLSIEDKLSETVKVSFSSTVSSAITDTLTLLIVIPLSNVAVSGVVLKSTPPVSQTLFTKHIIIHNELLPSADTTGCSNGVTVTLNGLLDTPPTSSSDNITNPKASELVYCSCINFTLISTNIKHTTKHHRTSSD